MHCGAAVKEFIDYINNRVGISAEIPSDFYALQRRIKQILFNRNAIAIIGDHKVKVVFRDNGDAIQIDSAGRVNYRLA